MPSALPRSRRLRERASAFAHASALALALALALAPLPALAAQPTDVADAMDPDHPVEVDVEAVFTHVRRDVRITRENVQTDPLTQQRGIVLVDELQHMNEVDRLDFRLAVGLYHDLELHFDVPLILGDQQSWHYADVNGVSVESVSTLANNHLDISGCSGAGTPCDPNGAPSPILPGVGASKRAGLGDPTIGIAWAPFHESREEKLPGDLFPYAHTLASWVIGLDYTLPLPGDVDDLSKYGFAAATPAGSAAVPVSRSLLRKAHVFSPWTGFSKRFKVLDPYLLLRATLPIVSRGAGVNDGAYDNCWYADPALKLMSDVAVQNCASATWKDQTGYQPSFTGTVTLGTELVAAESPHGQQKFAVDLHVAATWFSQGRNYSEVSDALGKLTFTDEHATFEGSLGLYGRAARWLHFRVAGSMGLDTAHFLTSEPIGKDLNGDGRITISAGSANKSLEQSPTYDFRLDQVGRRLRAEATFFWSVSGVMSFNF